MLYWCEPILRWNQNTPGEVGYYEGYCCPGDAVGNHGIDDKG